jgi:HlyD family secretion protein
VILQFKGKPADSLQAHDFRVDVRVVVREAKNAVRVPLGALFRHGNGWALYKVVDDRAQLTEVQVAEADPHFRAVTAGITEGDTVIVFPGSSVTDGARIRPRK